MQPRQTPAQALDLAVDEAGVASVRVATDRGELVSRHGPARGERDHDPRHADGKAGRSHQARHLGAMVAVAAVNLGLKLRHPVAQPGQLGVDAVGRGHVDGGAKKQNTP